MDLNKILIEAGLDTNGVSDAQVAQILDGLRESLFNRVGYKFAELLDDETLQKFNDLIEQESPEAFNVIDEALPNAKEVIEGVAKELVEEYNLISS